MAECIRHPSNPIRYLCITELCSNPLMCEHCIPQIHEGHTILLLNQSIRQFSNINRNSRTRQAKQNQLKLLAYMKDLQQKSNKICDQVTQWQSNYSQKLLDQYNLVMETFSNRYLEHVWKVLNLNPQKQIIQPFLKEKYNPQKHKKDIKDIIANIKFLDNKEFANPDNIQLVARKIHQQISQGMQICSNQITKALLKLSKLFQSYNFNRCEQLLGNIDNMNSGRKIKYLKKQDQISKSRNLEGINWASTIPPNIKKQQQANFWLECNEDDQQQRQRLLKQCSEIMKMRVFESDGNQRQNKLLQINSQHKQDINENKSQDKLKRVLQKKISNTNKKVPKKLIKNAQQKIVNNQEISHTNSQNSSNNCDKQQNQTYLRKSKIKYPSVKLQPNFYQNKIKQQQINVPDFTTAIKNGTLIIKAQTGKQISSQNLIDTILNFEERQTISQLEIKGKNQFDQSCLDITCKKFPELKKLNYIYNYDEKAISLQLQQVFFEQVQQIKQCSVKICQQVLDNYGELENLENLLLGNIEIFQTQKLQIKNKNIKHLTLGDYLKQQTIKLPSNLINVITSQKFSLLTLNLFNIKDMNQTTINNIMDSQPDIKQLWISQCNQLGSGFFSNFGKSKICTLILDQLKIIDQLELPKTLENIIIDNCSISYPIKGIQNSIKGYKNFSVFQCKYTSSDANNGNNFIEQLSKTSKHTLKYLNLGVNPQLTNQCLYLLGQFQELQYLCLNKTNIKIPDIFNSPAKKMGKLQKLDIMKLKGNTDKNISSLGSAFPALTCLCISYRKTMNVSSFSTMKNLKNLILQYKQQKGLKTQKIQKNESFMQFLQQMKQRGIRVYHHNQ